MPMKPYFLCLFLAMASLCVLAPRVPDAQLVTVSPRDDGRVLENPGMGWMFYYYDDSLSDFNTSLTPSDNLAEFSGITVVYMRLAWSYLEPEPGKFAWGLIDGPISRFTDQGKKVAFRFTTAESGDPGYATPRWVQAAGVKGYYFQKDVGIVSHSDHWEPDYDDPAFLREYSKFLRAVAAHLALVNSSVAFIDVSFGTWGEGHTKYSSRKPYTAATIDRIVDVYRGAFPHYLLTVNDDMASQGRGMEPLQRAALLGLTLRDDSILVNAGRGFESDGMAQLFWPRTPVILESQFYGLSRDNGLWRDGSAYLKALEAYHASYVAIHWAPREFLAQNEDLVRKMNMRLGYRLLPSRVEWPAVAFRGSTITVNYELLNLGVAPCYGGGHVAISLADRSGHVVGTWADSHIDVKLANPNGAQSHAVLKGQLGIPIAANLASGSYEVLISVGDRNGRPSIELPLGNGDGKQRYLLGTIKIR